MEELIAWILLIVALLIVLPFVLGYIATGAYWFMAVSGFLSFAVLDRLFAADLLPGAPWLLWAIWGAVLGAAFAFWTIAPVYGLRKQRPWIALAPFALMVVVLLTRTVIG